MFGCGARGAGISPRAFGHDKHYLSLTWCNEDWLFMLGRSLVCGPVGY